MLSRAYYSNPIPIFLSDAENSILGSLGRHHSHDIEKLQENAWIEQIKILKQQFSDLRDGHILFEYSIPRMGKRVDNILLMNGIVFVLEFKIGEKHYPLYALDQVLDYALDLKNFHEQSHHKKIVPILISTHAPAYINVIQPFGDAVFEPLRTNKDNLMNLINWVSDEHRDGQLDVAAWQQSIYKPTPTIIEAAQALYKGHSVKEISRSDGGAINLSRTSEAIAKIIEDSKQCNHKSICFITGVPGAGKTLAGLNIANERHNIDEGEHAVFLSGNGPLVQVLQEALARNEVEEKKGTPEQLTKSEALRHTKVFIQNIHHYRDDSLQTNEPPIGQVAVFDEAQRAWTLEHTSSFMKQKKGILDFAMSEPEFLIGVMNRHQGWAIIICLIGGGQEINTGEAGLPEWFSSLQKDYPNWDVYVSDKLTDFEYTQGMDLFSKIQHSRLHIQPDLHLSVSVRSFRSEKVSAFVKAVLDINVNKASELHSSLRNNYPIVLTRNLQKAKDWLKHNSRGTERHGLVASSGAIRLKPFGVHVKSKIDPPNWFLNDKKDIRSSYFLEETATEFDIQGLELDWTGVCWDADLRFNDGQWDYKDFRGTAWNNVNDGIRKLYLKNAYRVLLTRARQGMVIFVPEGDPTDHTRQPEFYDQTAEYLIQCGIPLLD
ncbi:MAG: DUF2075 domain-containing protein [Deltaproteobacteria bacterium]|nr:DUF2075 domain-containing protein [Deltaproteobacteria bacterium]